MTEPMLSDTKNSAMKPVKKIGIWDDRERFLGMFSSYNIPAPALLKTPRIGLGDHLQTCHQCAGAGGEIHPRLHALFVFVKLGSKIHTMSWPTWASF